MISVCMATYNGVQFVTRQLDTVLEQLSPSDEVIIVDDGSKDGTVQTIKDHYGDRVAVYVNEKNAGAIKSFERAISLAKGDILFLCDQDDLWEENKVEKVVRAFEEQNAAMVIHDAYVVDGDLKILHSSWNEYNHNSISQGIIGNIVKNAFTGAFMAFKKELVPTILPFPPSIEMHDQWIALVCMMEKKKIVFLDEPLMKYVRHGGNVTGMKKRPLSTQLKGRIGTISAIMGYRRNR